MVQISSETPKQGQAWTIHLTNLPIFLSDQAVDRGNMEYFQEAIQLAKTKEHVSPQWMDKTTLPLEPHKKITQRAIDVYMLSKKTNGEMGGIGWWQTANGYTAMVLHDIWSQDDHNYEALSTTIRECEAHHKDLIHPWNDDMLWWGLLCLHMFNVKEECWFLQQAQGIWKHVSRCVCKRGDVLFEHQDMEGAVFWTTRAGEDQINAITTGLFAELSVRLALVKRGASQSWNVSHKDYIEAARCSLGWILRCRYTPKEGIVLDNIRLKEGKRNDWIFTYNTGVALGVCALLFEATKDSDYFALARHMALKAMTYIRWVEDDGVLTEKHAYGRGTHDPWKSNDAVGFKAVLIRQLCTLHDVINRTPVAEDGASDLLNTIRNFVLINFRSQMERNSNGRGQYGPWWAGPFECPTSHSQMAVLDIMAAVRLMDR